MVGLNFYDDIAADRYEYFIVDTGTFKSRCPAPFWKVITFLGNGGWFWLVLAAGLLVCKKTRLTGIAALLSITVGFPSHECAAEEYCCPPKTFLTLIQRDYFSDHKNQRIFHSRLVIHVHHLRAR